MSLTRAKLWWLDNSFYKIAALMQHSQSAVGPSDRVTNSQGPLMRAEGRWATVALNAQDVDADPSKKMWDCTAHHSWLHNEKPCSWWPLCPPPQQAREHQNWTREQWTKVTLLAESHFYMCATYLGSARHQKAQQTGRQFAAGKPLVLSSTWMLL